ALTQGGKLLGQVLPRVPDRAEEFAGEPVGNEGSEKNAELCALRQRRAALSALLQRLLVEVFADFFWSAGQHLIEQTRVERTGSDSIHVDMIEAKLFGERFGEAHDRSLRCGVNAESKKQGSRPAAEQVDDLAVTSALEMGNDRAARQHDA